jgi:hypothetical protein
VADSFISEEIVKMMPRPATMEQRLQRIRDYKELESFRRREEGIADAKYVYDDRSARA